MPLSDDDRRLIDDLTVGTRAAQDRALREIADAATSSRPRPRLRGLLADVNRWVASMVDGVRRWVGSSLPQAYQSGAVTAAGSIGGSFAWTGPHREAAEALARATWDDVATTLQGVTADTKRAIRSLLDDTVRAQVLDGVPGPRASAELARAIQERTGALTVRYADGSRRAVSDYADTVARTATATTRNAGALNQARADGIAYVEVYDGADCQWVTHNSGGLANGTVVTLEFAEDHSISHPRCARSFSPRPDVRSAEEAEEGRRYSVEEQEQMAAEERERAATRLVDGRPAGALSVAAAEGRQPRVARTPRAARG